MLDLTRQSGLIDSARAGSTTVRIVGVGAIGSHVAEVLCKMGIRCITVQDYDTVESHNLPNQGYYLDEMGMRKVDALAGRLLRGTGAPVVVDPTKLEGATVFEEEIVVAAVDSMATRRLIYDNFLESPHSFILVDGRMGARFGQVHFVDKARPGRLSEYEGTLHQGGLYQEPCTAKSTIFCAYGLAGVIGAFIAKYLMEEKVAKSADIDFTNLYMDREL